MSTRIYPLIILLLITLASFCLVKVGYVGLEHYLTGQMSKKKPARELLVDKEGKPQAVGKQKSYDYKIILTRNLFGPLQEGIEKKVVPKFDDNLKATELDIVLMGTIQGEKDANRAIIMDKKTSKQELYWVGDAIQGAQIKEIQRGKVILAFNGGYEILDMSEASKMRKSFAPAKPNLPGLKKRVLPKRKRRGLNVPAIVAPMDEKQQGDKLEDLQKPAKRQISRPKVIRPSRRIVPRK